MLTRIDQEWLVKYIPRQPGLGNIWANELLVMFLVLEAVTARSASARIISFG
jgi:hypothetical protein